jgi:hypothetical protein
MKLLFHPHAVERMQQRKLSVHEIIDVVVEPDGRIKQSFDKWILYKDLSHRKDNLIAAVVVEKKDEKTYEVITVLINFEVRK